MIQTQLDPKNRATIFEFSLYFQFFLETQQYAPHHRVRLRSVHHPAESDSVWSIIPLRSNENKYLIRVEWFSAY